MMWSVLFPTQMFQPRSVDDAFGKQLAAAQQAGFATSLLNQDALEMGDFNKAVQGVSHTGPMLYRGWMLSAPHYAKLAQALAAKDIVLINTAEQYAHCHHLPDSFELIREHTPASVWVPAADGEVNLARVVESAAAFGDKAVVIKDWVKSRKHEWHEACFIPSASDAASVSKIAATFVERQGDNLTGGVVIREFIELQSVGTHPKSGMPLTKEFRVFVLDGEPLLAARYWSDGSYAEDDLPLDQFAAIMRSVQSRFFTMDIAQGIDGVWRIIELGDGQVAGLLDSIGEAEFFAALAARLR